jgi:hypothetical protein
MNALCVHECNLFVTGKLISQLLLASDKIHTVAHLVVATATTNPAKLISRINL